MINAIHTRNELLAVLLGILIINVIVIVYIYNEISSGYYKIFSFYTEEERNQLLTNYVKCKIPEIDPFNEEMMKFFERKQYRNCSKHDLLTYVIKDRRRRNAILYINTTTSKQYAKEVNCCYSSIYRVENDDNSIKVNACQPFKLKTIIPPQPILVKCNENEDDDYFYENVHYPITIKDEILHKINNRKSLYSVLILGVDGMSKFNMMRTMPMTKYFLTENDFVDMKGFNQVGDNTFPNLMATLTGKNEAHAKRSCNVYEKETLDKCSIIWKDFNQSNYITAYAEDISSYSMFSALKEGFEKEPVDFYFRPYMIAAETYLKSQNEDTEYCSGPETYTERMLNAIKDFTSTLIHQPTFGIFWMHSITRDDLNEPTRIDSKVYDFFNDLKANKIFENTIVILMSDHGLRFGSSRYTYTGWLEERLPILSIRLPKKFKTEHYDKYESLKKNANKLTNHYDLYMTLQNILNLKNNNAVEKSQGCPNCKSLFETLEERTCDEISIDIKWCSCYTHLITTTDNKDAIKAAERIEYEINSKSRLTFCATFTLKKILSAHIIVKATNKDTYIVVTAEFKPEGVFEACFARNETDLKLHSKISRVDENAARSSCQDDPDHLPEDKIPNCFCT